MATSSNDADQYSVYRGIWTNWSRGQVLGLTLTLRRQEANLLIAFTAFFVAFISTRFWRILCFAFHRNHSTARLQTVVYHQRQTILRNSTTPESGMQQILRLLWANRNVRKQYDIMLIAIFAAINITAFAAAGGLSSQISTAVGTEVLIQSLNCGYLDEAYTNPNGHHNSSQAVSFRLLESSREAQSVENAVNYAKQCYSNNTAGMLDCGRFVKKFIASFVDNEASCPVHEKMCRSNSANIRIDSGYINSHRYLGLNSPIEDRILARNVLHCAPITTTGFTSRKNTSLGDLTMYHYGSSLEPSGKKDYMFAAESIESQYAFALSPDDSNNDMVQRIVSLSYYIKNRSLDPHSHFIPIDLIWRQDADVTIIFLSGQGVLYTTPSTDEWHRLSPTETISPIVDASSIGSTAIYLPLEPASPLLCTNQYQFCRRDVRHCGPLASFRDAVAGAAPIFNSTYLDVSINRADSKSSGQFNYFIAAFHNELFTSLHDLLGQLGAGSLASASTLLSGFQSPLPSNQWQLDVIRWSDIVRASMQAAFLSIAYLNPPDSSVLEYRKSFASPDSERLCHNQKINSTAHASFSLFGLLFTFVVGCLIALISYLLEPVSKLLYKKWGFKTYAYLEWNTNATLQLQRLAHEELGWDTWSKGTGEIPTTEPGDLLGCLDISNPDHPVLLQPHTRGSSTDEAKTSQSTPQIAIPSFQDQSYQSQESIGDDIHASPVAERPPADPFHSNSTNCKPCLQAQ